MKDYYSVAGISKQAVWKRIKRDENTLDMQVEVVDSMNKIRENNRRMGCRTMYYATPVAPVVGRDRFEQIGLSNGFRLKRKKNACKTTSGQTREVFPNLIEGLMIDNVNQVWQSDTFYQKVENVFYYVICIQDVCSRCLLSFHVSRSLQAIENVKALQEAIKARYGSPMDGCIFHTDRGSQYISAEHKKLIKQLNMKSSMCKVPQGNAYAERINGTMKNDYLGETTLTIKNIQQQAKRAMQLYNERPHSSLKMMSPTAYEQHIRKLGDNDRPTLRIHNWSATLSTENQVVNKEKRSKKESLPNT